MKYELSTVETVQARIDEIQDADYIGVSMYKHTVWDDDSLYCLTLRADNDDCDEGYPYLLGDYYLKREDVKFLRNIRFE